MNIFEHKIQLNKINNSCVMCGKEIDPIESEIFMIRGWTYCTCKDCCSKVVDFIKKEI